MWASPVVAAFFTYSIIVGVAVGLMLAFAHGGLQDFWERILPPKTDNTYVTAEAMGSIPFSPVEQFIAAFELRYHPHYGKCPNKELRVIVFTEFWNEVRLGHIDDAFALFHQERRSGSSLTASQRAELLKDLLDLASRSDKE